MTKASILVTGASGFIGRHLVSTLLDGSSAEVRVLVRSTPAGLDRFTSRTKVVVGDLTQSESLENLCDGIATVYHLAGYAHAEDSEQTSGERLHRRITIDGTRALIESAVAAGVERFVFVSSVKAMGEGGDATLNEDSESPPTTAYGKAKREAEDLVLSAAEEHGFHAAVLRLPLVYGRDNKGNIPRMIAAVDRGRFPPLPAVHNRRSMVHVDDVVRALIAVAGDSRANGQRYIVTDGHNYSTREIYELICGALGRPVPRWSVPLGALRAVAYLGDAAALMLGRPVPLDSSTLTKLLGSACYSSEKIRRDIGFHPTRRFSDGLVEMIEHRRLTS